MTSKLMRVDPLAPAKISSSGIIPSYTIARLIGLLLVVIGHSQYIKMGTYAGSFDMSSIYANTSKCSDVFSWIVGRIYLFHMPLFVFISGAIFSAATQKESSPSTAKRVEDLAKKARRLLLPFAVCALFWSIPVKTLCGFYAVKDLTNVVLMGHFLGLGAGHLWFLMMLFGVFTLIASTGNIWRNWWISIPVTFVLHELSPHMDIAVFGLRDVALYTFYFILGGFYHAIRHQPSISRTSAVSLMLFCGIAFHTLTIYFLSGETQWSGIIGGIERDLILVFVSLSGTLMIIFLAESIALFASESAIVRYIVFDRHSMNIYLIHDPINYVILSLFAAWRLPDLFSIQGNNAAIAMTVSRIAIPLIGAALISMLVFRLSTWLKSKRENKCPA